MKTTINSRIAEKQAALGRVIIASAVGGQPSLAKGSNCRAVADSFLRQFPALTIDQVMVIPGARRRYRSEGYLNVIVVL